MRVLGEDECQEMARCSCRDVFLTVTEAGKVRIVRSRLRLEAFTGFAVITGWPDCAGRQIEEVGNGPFTLDARFAGR